MASPFNRDRFAKVIALAESEHDGEALVAVRKARDIARSAGLSLGEAVSSSIDASGFAHYSAVGGAKDAILAIAYRRIKELEGVIASLERQKRPRREAEDAEMYGSGYRVGYKAGFDDGQRSEIGATNRAYDRGYADGKASVQAGPEPNAKKKRRL